MARKNWAPSTIWTLKQSNIRWHQSSNAAHAKLFLPKINSKQSEELCNLNRRKLRIITGFLTGHCCLNKFLYRIGKSTSPACRVCKDPSSTENIEHFLSLCNNQEIQKMRLRHFSTPLLMKNEYHAVNHKNILDFAYESGIYKCFFTRQNDQSW